jgi:hypothetical protein
MFDAIVLLLSLTPAWTPQERPTAADVFTRTSAAVVTIRTATGQGSGVVIDPSGVIITNLHTIKSDTKATITLANGDVYDDISVIDVDARRDLALLKIKAFKLISVELGDSDDLAVGAKVYAIGSPRGLSASISEGLISALRGSGDGYRMVQTTAAISPGSSGGGLFDETGRLVAITTFAVQGGENLNFAIPINYARGMMSTEPRMTLAELSRSLRTEPAAAATPAKPSIPRLNKVYMNGASADVALFEPQDDGSFHASLTTGKGVVYSSATLTWDPAKKAFTGKGVLQAPCGGNDKRVVSAPIVQEVFVVAENMIRDRWSAPSRLNCGKGIVVEYTWQELLRYVPPVK